MLSETSLLIISFLATAGATSNTNYFKDRGFYDYQPANRIQLKETYKKPKISLTNSLENKAYMTLTSVKRKNTMGNPIYLLSLYADGQKIGEYPAVTGRAYTQSRNRHISGTEAPLPTGRYSVATSIVPGTHPEVGGRFLPIYPLFETGRSALGIHYDPSFDQNNGQDGTAGCVALTNKQDLDLILSFIRTYQPQYLEVQF